MDASTRDLERRAAAGDADALARLYVARIRTGDGRALLDDLFARLLDDTIRPQELEALVIVRAELPEVRRRLLDQELKRARANTRESDRLLDAFLVARPWEPKEARRRPKAFAAGFAILDAAPGVQAEVAVAGFERLREGTRRAGATPLTPEVIRGLEHLLQQLLRRTKSCPLTPADLARIVATGRDAVRPESTVWRHVLDRLARLRRPLPEPLVEALQGTTTFDGVFAFPERRARIRKLLDRPA